MPFPRKKNLPALKKHPSSGGKTRRRKIKYTLSWIYPTIFVMILVSLGILYLSLTAKITSLQYQMVRMKREKAKLCTQNKELILAIERLESLDRVEKLAKNELKMVYPEKRLTLNLKRGTSTAFALDEIGTQ